MPATIADVARAAGVSKTTVSRVLNGKGEVDRGTAARVRAVIDVLGYVPSSRAVGLARGHSRAVGMLVPSLTWPWVSEMLQGVVDTVAAAEYGLLLFTFEPGSESFERCISQGSARAFDGLVAVEPGDNLDALTALRRQGFPLVLIADRSLHELPTVAAANNRGGASAAHHLIATGRSRPLVVTGPEHFGCVTDRLRGFTEVLPPAHLHAGDLTEQAGWIAVSQLIDRSLQFDSVFACNDLSATGALRALREAGRTVPGDVAVIGFDDIPMAQYTAPPLTTIRQPMRAMGAMAAQVLLAHLDGADMRNERTVLPTELVVRLSA